MKQLALTITMTLVTLAGILILWQLRSIVLLFFFSIVIAAVLHSPIDHLVERQWPRWVAMLLVYSIVCLGLGGLVLAISLPVVAEVEMLLVDIGQKYEQGSGWVQTDMFSAISWVRWLPSTEVVGEFLLNSQATMITKRLLGFTQGFTIFGGQVVLAIVLSIYWAADKWHFERLWLSLLAPAQRGRTRALWYTLEHNVGAYLRSEVGQSVLGGGLLTLGFWLMGLPYPCVMATIGSFAWFIPLVGALIAIPLIAFVALLNGTTLAIASIVYTISVFLFLEFVVEPRLYDRSRHGLILVVVVMMAMVEVFGLLGLLLAPPLALTIQIVLDELLTSTRSESFTEIISLTDIEDQLNQVRAATDSVGEPSMRISSMITRLEKLLQETKEADESI